ncbi:MAG: prefoldin subunit alpha [Candidatus Aenigmarchaeota archaeon]|nr:prefoldin subunit alpha [Candidatus Aenigmarchaeota archaeon]
MAKTKKEKTVDNKNTGNEKEELQKLYMQYEIMKQYSAVYNQENAAIEAKLAEIAVTIEAIKGLPKLDKQNEFLTNLGSSVFMSAEIAENDKVIIEIGSGVFGKKPVDEALQMLEKRRQELEKTSSQLQMEMTSLNMQLHHLEPHIQELMQKMQ